MASIPLRMILYVDIGSSPANGGLKEKTNITNWRLSMRSLSKTASTLKLFKIRCVSFWLVSLNCSELLPTIHS